MSHPCILSILLLFIGGQLAGQTYADRSRARDRGPVAGEQDSVPGSTLSSDYVYDFVRSRTDKGFDHYTSENLLNARSSNNYVSNLYDSKPSYFTKTTLPLRQGMSASTAAKGLVPEGAEVKVVSSLFGKWWEVYYNGQTGYLESEYLSKEKVEKALVAGASGEQVSNFTEKGEGQYIVTQETSLRTQADSQARVILRFKAGDQVEVLNDSGEWWWEVQFGQSRGWVKRQLLSRD